MGSIDRPHLVFAGNIRSPNVIRAYENDTRFLCTRRPRSQTTILAGTAPSRPDYRLVARSVLAAPAAFGPRRLRNIR